MAVETYMDYTRKPVRCEDGQEHRIYVKRYRFDGSYAADTFFSVPAYRMVNGKRVHGFVMMEDGELTFTPNRF